MTNDLAKRPGSVMRTYTQQVRDHAQAMARAQDEYFAGLKRLEAAYFDKVKRITEALTQGTQPIAEENTPDAPSA